MMSCNIFARHPGGGGPYFSESTSRSGFLCFVHLFVPVTVQRPWTDEGVEANGADPAFSAITVANTNLLKTPKSIRSPPPFPFLFSLDSHLFSGVHTLTRVSP